MRDSKANKIEERDQILYDIFKDRFNSELNRIRDLDQKSSNIISFIGIIISIQSALGVFLLKEIPKSSFYWIASVIFAFGMLFLLVAMRYAIKSYWVQDYIDVPGDPKDVFENYCKTNSHKLRILRNFSIEICKATRKNRNINDNKVTNIKRSLQFLILGIGSDFLFIIVLLLMKN